VCHGKELKFKMENSKGKREEGGRLKVKSERLKKE
jgi:hypothetical protein